MTLKILMHCFIFISFRNYSRFWSYLWDYRHGNCFMFNGGKDDEGKTQKVLRSHTTGPTGGMYYVVLKK